MSTDNPISTGSEPTPPISNVPQDGDSIAATYLATQVRQARTALQRTRIVGVVLLLLLGGEMIFITSKFSASLQPHSAAEIADGMILQQINDRGPDLAGQLKQKIPEYIQQTPDYALRELPKYRQSLEDRLEAQLTQYCQKSSDQLDKQLDSYLTDHKDEIKGLITDGNNPEVAKRVGQDLKQQFSTYVHAKTAGGESIQDQLDVSLAALQGTAKTMHRLATAPRSDGAGEADPARPGRSDQLPAVTQHRNRAAHDAFASWAASAWEVKKVYRPPRWMVWPNRVMPPGTYRVWPPVLLPGSPRVVPPLVEVMPCPLRPEEPEVV